MVIGTEKPTWRRLSQLRKFMRQNSLLRSLQYEQLAKTQINGKLLDIGGGEKARYRTFLGATDYFSVNISEELNPTWVTKPGQAFTFIDEKFDNVLALNTLEHVYDSRQFVEQAESVLKQNGNIILATPFLFRVHGSPDDYFRPTASWFEKCLVELGFNNVQIIPQLWGPFSTGAISSGLPGPFSSARLHLAMLLDVLYAKLKFRNEPKLQNKQGNSIQNSPLGYFVTATKNKL